MPRITIDNDSKVYYGSSYGQVAFSLVSAPKDGWKQIREFAGCRDYINDCIIAAANAHHFNNGKGQGYWVAGTNAPVDFNYLRLLIVKDPAKTPRDNSIPATHETDKRRIYKAKHIINMYEELAGFKRKSTIKQVKHSSGKVPHCWLLTGPSQWMRATQLVSMVTLIFRVVTTHGGFQECNNLDQVEEQFKKLCVIGAKPNTFYVPGAGDLKMLLPATWPKFRTIMTEYDKLFGSKPKDFWFPKAGVGNWHSPGGIYSLCVNNLLVKELKDAAKSVLG